MNFIEFILSWVASISWPIVVLIIITIFRVPIFTLLDRIGSIADRVSRESVDIQLGEKLKISFREALHRANPKSVEEALAVAEREADKAFSIFEVLNNVPLQRHHKDLLLKIAKSGEAGMTWVYKGLPANAPGRTMGFLLEHNLVNYDGNKYYVHALVRQFIFDEFEHK